MAPKYPSIPEPTLEPTSLRDSILSIKQMLEVLTGQRGNHDYAAVTFGDLGTSEGETPIGSTSATDIVVTPAGNIGSINVQLALEELDTEKVAKTGDTMVGHLSLPTGPIAANAVRKDYVDAADTTLTSAVALKADIASPTLTGDPKAPTPTVGDNDTSIATTAFVTTAVATAGATGSLQTQHDYIVNGHHLVSQENGTTAGTASSFFPADMWFISYIMGGTITLQNVAITDGVSTRAIRATASVADASVAAGDVVLLVHRLEGYDVADLKIGTANAKTITVGFNVKAPAGTYCVGFANGAANRSRNQEYVISVGEANTRVRKYVTCPLDQSGTWDNAGGLGLSIYWVLMAGTDWQGATATWASTNDIATSSQFNFMGTASNVFELSDVTMVQGSVDPGVGRVPDYAATFKKCQRYYQPLPYLAYIGNVTSGSNYYHHFTYPEEMRIAPTSTSATVISTANFPTSNPSLGSITTKVFLATLPTANGSAVGIYNYSVVLNARL